MAEENFLKIEEISKIFGSIYAVDNVSINIKQGEIFALLGSSGCGKSTLLRILAGLEEPSSGKIYIESEDVTGLPPYKRPVNMMFQSYALFPHLNVQKNIHFGLKQDKKSSKEINDITEKVLSMVHMNHLADRKIHQLSGGQRQRVALARILAKGPKVLLLDEPMSALDKKLREKMQLELVNIIESVGITCIIVTHDQEEAMTMASRIAIMHEGKLIQIGSPQEIYETPNSVYSAEFIGNVNIFEGKVSVDESDYVMITSSEIPSGIYVNHGITGNLGQNVSVAVRPEKININKSKPPQENNWIVGVVKDIQYYGNLSSYYISSNSGKLYKSTRQNQDRFQDDMPTWGDQVYFSWDSSSNIVITH